MSEARSIVGRLGPSEAIRETSTVATDIRERAIEVVQTQREDKKSCRYCKKEQSLY
jgi:hypothetical protein